MRSQGFFFAVCCVFVLALSINTATAQTAREMTLDWDLTAFSTIADFKLAMTNTINACDTVSKPSYWKLNGGTSPTNFLLRVADKTSAFMTSPCGVSIKAKFPSISSDSLYSGPAQCHLASVGFVQGYPSCTVILGEGCTSASACATGTQCINSVVAVSPTFHLFQYSFDAIPATADDAAGMYAAAKSQFTAAIAAEDCAASGTDNDLSIFEYAGAATDDMIMIYIAQRGSLTAACKTAITTLPSVSNPDAAFNTLATPTLTAIASQTAATILDTACYARSSAGFIQKLKFGSTCDVSLAIGAVCSTSLDCPGQQSVCETAPSLGNICIHKDLAAYTAANNFGKITITYPVQQTTANSAKAVAALVIASSTVQSLCGELTIARTAAVASPGGVTAFDILFFQPVAPVVFDGDCIAALETIPSGVSPTVSSITYATVAINSLSCISTKDASTVTGFTPGGRCDYKMPVGGVCTVDSDCDATTTPATQCVPSGSASVCVKPGTDETTGDTVVVRRIDLEATAYLGSEMGQKRIEAYIERLKTISGCVFTSASHAIGNSVYTTAYIYVTPFDITTCGLDKMASAVTLANQAVVTASIDESNLLSPGSSQENIELLSATAIYHALAEEEGGTTPVDPVVVIPTIRTSMAKIFKYNVPKECMSGTELECTADCLIPCPFAHTCATASECGPNAKCDSQYLKCSQSGTAQEGYVPSNGAHTAHLATIAVILSFIVALF